MSGIIRISSIKLSVALWKLAEFIKYHCSKDEINDLSKMIERWL